MRSAELRAGRSALAVLLLHSVLVQAVTFVMRPTSTYRALELGVPATWLGVLSASFAIAPLVLAVPSGQSVEVFADFGGVPDDVEAIDVQLPQFGTVSQVSIS